MRPQGQGIGDAIARFLNNFSKPAKLLVAVSGGGDSIGLLMALDAALQSGRHPGFTVAACTVDHALRDASAEEARWVADVCARRGIAHVTRRWAGEKPARGIQAAARAVRHALLAEAARAIGADAILTAHNRDDRRETVAMRAARSTEGAGLAGIAPATLLFRSIWVLRPLLGVSREEIRAYLKGIDQPWLEDPSNENRAFERVRIRKDGADELLDKTAQSAAAVRIRHAGEGAAYLARHMQVFDASLAQLPSASIAALEERANWQAFLSVVAVLGGREHRLERAAADRLAAFLRGGEPTRMTAGRVAFDRRREGLFMYREMRGIGALEIAAGGEAVWDGRWRIGNHGSSALFVDADGGTATSRWDGVPAGVVARAFRTRPRLRSGSGEPVTSGFSAEAVLAPFDSHLPLFDLPLANAIAGLFGLPVFSEPPAMMAESD
ncbi:tRNA(Ile)-lysidine synthase [Rhizobium subbaraonis]|uniref:tRNA(Ile)-lysidine synthase n=1 Tax=Rhizobium subbaraonis TaxID=908946 RepID=A0A285U589_9HYPH|nr:tRNA lysidine(34) synthetase TilS [Rhizobium subbaraonis]SOC37012.1 tRNA(Ile)-lysidine synthase [Rhizobium subbaraonis]